MCGGSLMSRISFLSLDVLCLLYSLWLIPGQHFTYSLLRSQCPHCRAPRGTRGDHQHTDILGVSALLCWRAWTWNPEVHRELIPAEMFRRKEKAYPGSVESGRCGSGAGSVDFQTRTARLADPSPWSVFLKCTEFSQGSNSVNCTDPGHEHLRSGSRKCKSR